jgi:phosphonate transport system substrate-binding protein
MTKTFFREGRVALAIVPFLFLPACSGSDYAADGASATLRFSAIPDDNSTELREKYSLIAGYLSDTLGVPVEYVPASDYSASVEAFVNGDVQLAWFGGLTGVQARARVEGAHAIAQGKVDPEYVSYFIAHKDSGLTPGQDFPAGIADLSFTFGSDSSTSGRLMPEHFIRQNSGQSPQEFFGTEELNFSGSHDKTAKLVEAGTYQSGALSYTTYDRMVADGKLDPEVCVKIWTTPGYPDYNWTAHPVLEERYGEGFTERLQAALVGMSDPALLEAAQRPAGMIPATNADFQPIHDLAVDLGFLD